MQHFSGDVCDKSPCPQWEFDKPRRIDAETLSNSRDSSHSATQLSARADAVSSQLKYILDTESASQRIVMAIVYRRVHITSMAFFVIVAGSLLCGARTHDLTDTHDIQSWVGLLLVFSGLGIRSWAAGTLHKWSKLTTAGPYSLVRNPLYVGSFVLMIGFCTLLGQASNLWIISGFFFALLFGAVRKEEKILAEQYGTLWDCYAKATPRFIPYTLVPCSGNWTIKQWKTNKEYQAVSTAILGLMALMVLQYMQFD